MSFSGYMGLDRRNPKPPKEDVVTSTKTRVSKIGNVVIPVSDQSKEIAFYTETLGFEMRADIAFGPENNYRWVEVAPEGADTTIALAPPPEGQPSGNRETGIGLYTDDIDALHAELKAAGADIDAEIQRFGDPVPPLCWLRDPEGNSLMLVEIR
jgi:catechol 2,3-dioxygenase-like lactoylglutathione lyase family enzyme